MLTFEPERYWEIFSGKLLTGNVEEEEEEEEEEEGEEKGIIVLRINLVTVEVRYRMPRSPPGIMKTSSCKSSISESILSVHNGIAEDNEQTRRELRKRIATRESDPTDQKDAERTSSIYTYRKVIDCTLEP
ncbi:hypothetical protein T12_9998 [Trichinella patagoniensis]|uniref:Uncharacterized protein n=1 Tax=Trichinella patagoniensis TaxID=990121 RepID=A0A0V1AA93_9BILA|nr:hypothetical protein T12_9998 [Trichinella patagoniensis]